MINQIKTSFVQHFGAKPLLFKASGRVNIIGEHTDYNLGFSLPVSIDKAIYFAAQPSGSGQFNIVSLDMGESNGFQLDTADEPGQGWVNYFKAIVGILLEKGLPIQGVNLLFGGTLPAGAGLSSSAALCCGFVYSLDTLFELGLSKKEMALVAQQAEHRIGLLCGLLDQYSVLFGQKDHALRVDFQSLEHQTYPINLRGAELILINSRLEHDLAEDSEYNERRASCQRVVDEVRKEEAAVESLRDISVEMLERFRDRIDPIDFGRARFVQQENERVQQAIAYFGNGDIEAFGQLLYQSQDGQRDQYHISTPEIDQLISLTRAEEDILGARMTGGGFGGCIICLVREGAIAAVERVANTYHQQTGIQPDIYPIQTADGILRLDN